jgi:single-stranded-DNA-specific exonuclease
MAAGLKVSTAKVGEFREAFVEVANNGLTGDDLVPKLRLDGEVMLSELTMPAAEMVASLGPFGIGNPRPLFATDWMELAAEPRAVGSKEAHLQASFRQNGSMVRGIGFRLAAHLEDLKQHRRCRAAFEPIINEYNGRRSVEMHIVDLRFPSA